MGLFKKKKKKQTEEVTIKENKKNNNEVKEGTEEQSKEALDFQNIEPTIFEKNRKSIKDLIAGEHIDFTEDPRFGTVGDKYYAKNVYVGLLPNQVNFASFLHPLYNYGNIDTSIFINPVDNETAKAELSKLKTNLEVELYSAEGSNRMDDMLVKVHEARRLRSEVRDGLNKIFEVSIQATYYEEDLRALNNGIDRLKETLGQADIGLKSATYIQEEAFRSNKPLINNMIGEYHTFDKRSLACVFPFTTNNINHPNGVPIGFNQDNGLPIIYDTFDKSLDNYNMVIFAKSGGGKSTTIKMLSARSASLDNIQTVSIDIDGEYKEICKTLGGQDIVFAPGTDTIINPFDIKPDIVKNKFTGKIEEKILLEEKINSATSVLLTMAKGTIGQNPYYNDITKNIIKEIVKIEYGRVGITSDPNSLYEIKEQKIVEGKMVGGKTKKILPTLSSWYQQLEKQSKENTVDTYTKYYDYLIKVMADFTKYKNGGLTYFDGQSTVEVSYDIPYINFDVSSLNEKNELPLAQHIIYDYIWEKMVKQNQPELTGTNHKIRVTLDEAWRMIAFPEALEFLIEMFRRSRKYNTQTVVISQQFDEFYKEETKPIIKNSDTKLFLKPDKSSVNEIKKVFRLTEGESEFLRSCKRGEGLIIVNSVSAKVSIEIPEVEFAFIETNQNARAEREKNKKQKVGA